jgi:glycosyltransferase involved in cell wall biosynthesis
MKVLYFDPKFLTPRHAAPTRAYSIARCLVGASDLTLAVFAPNPALELNSPNKFFDSLAAGKPVLVNVDSWPRKLVEENTASVYAPGGDAEALAGALSTLARQRERLGEMGENARALAVREFARDPLTDRLAATLEEIADRGGRAARP